MVPQPRILTAALVLCALFFAPAARASLTQQSILMDDNELIYSSPGHVAATLARLRSLGVDVVKVSVVWGLVAPDAKSATQPKFNATDPQAYPPGAWDRYDTVVRVATGLGMRVYFQLTPFTPTWGLAPSLPRGQGLPTGQAPNPALFEKFVEAAGRRYSGSFVVNSSSRAALTPPPAPTTLGLPIGFSRAVSPGAHTLGRARAADGPIPAVRMWGVWNEPNFPSWLNPSVRRLEHGFRQYTQPLIYRGIVDSAYSALTATGHSGDTILIGETAQFGNLYSVPFIEDVFCLSSRFRPLRGADAVRVGCPTSGNRAAFAASHPGLFAASGWAHHPYSFDIAPDRPYPTANWVTIYNLDVMEHALNDVYAAYGRGRRGGIPLYLSEWGYKSNPPNPYVRTSLTQQAAWINGGEYLAWKLPYVRALAQFLFVDDGPRTSEPVGSRLYWHNFQTGLMFHDGGEKPAYGAFRIPIWLPVARHGPRVTVWGQLRPANHSGRQRGVIEWQAAHRSGWAQLRVLQTASPEGFVLAHVRIPGPGAVRLAWREPGTGTVRRSRTVAVS